MALKIFEKYGPDRANAPTTGFPQGSIKNESVPGANDGTPLDQDWGNDYAGWDGALFAAAGITPDGNVDIATASQRHEAIKILIGKVSTLMFDTVADLAAGTPFVPDVNTFVRVKERGEYNLWFVTGSGTPDDYGVLDAGGSNTASLVIDASMGVSLVGVGVKNGNPDNHLRLEAASAIGVTNNCHINPDHKDVCDLSETPLLSVPISCDRPIRDVVFEQSDNSKSVLSFVAGMDFFHMHNFWARYTDSTQVQTAPAIFLTEENHNAKLSHIHTLGGSYGIHSDQVSFWQSYEHCRCDNYDLAQMRIDGDRNDLTGGGTTINITNCGGFNSNSNTADAALVLNSIGEVNIRTYESGQGKMRRLCLANSVFNLNIQSWHWELSEIMDGGFNLANCQAKIDGLYAQDINIPLATTVYLIENFKSTVQISNITKRGTAPDGTLNLMEASDAQVMTLADACIELSGEIQLDSLLITGTYEDATGSGKPITSQQLMLVDAPKVKIFNIESATPNTYYNFPFNGSKPQFMQITLGGTTKGVTDVIDGSIAQVTELTGGGVSSAAQFRYRWQQADGTQGVADQDIQIIAHYPKGWFEL